MGGALLLMPILQAAVLLLVLLKWSKVAAAICLSTFAIAWLVAATLVSAHVAAAAHLLWLVPAAWIAALALRRKRDAVAPSENADAA
jgi:hypothetical protein